MRYKLYATNSWNKDQYPGATILDEVFRTWVLMPTQFWWTPQEKPANCKQPWQECCSWESKMQGHHITLHIPKQPCCYCGEGLGSIGRFAKDGKTLIYHGYIQHGWIEDD